MFAGSAKLRPLLLLLVAAHGCNAAHERREEPQSLALDAACSPPPAPPSPTPATWDAAQSFDITLDWTGSCFGDCPSYAVRLDDAGHVHFRGKEAVDLLLPPQHVRELYSDMLRDGFLDLHDNYSSVADGCDEVATDSTSTIFGLHSSVGTKQVAFYWGCQSEDPALQKLRALADRVRSLIDVETLLNLQPLSDCDEVAPARKFAPSYQLGNDHGSAVGILRFTRDAEERRWIAETCGGHELTRGAVKFDQPCSARLVVDDGQPQRWPGLNASLTEIPLGPGDPNGEPAKSLLIRLSASDPNLVQLARAASDCLRITQRDDTTP